MTRASNTRNKPYLDEETFQRILAAAYALQKSERCKQARNIDDQVPEEFLLETRQPDVRPTNKLLSDIGPTKHIHAADDLFWNVAAVAAVAAILSLSFLAAVHRSSPLPSEISRSLESVPQSAPFQRTNLVVKSAATSAIQSMKDGNGPDRAERSLRAVAHKPSIPKNNGNPPTRHHARSKEDDIVAKDTVVYYGTGSAVASTRKP